MTTPPTAREIISKILSGYDLTIRVRECLRIDILRALIDYRNAALEEAAHLSEIAYIESAISGSAQYRYTLKPGEIAKEIRRLKEGEK